MGILTIGIVSLAVLIWVLASSLEAECRAEKRRITQLGEFGGDRDQTSVSGNPGQAA